MAIQGIESEWFDARPCVVVSRCLGFEACRWNGEMLRDEVVEILQPHVDFVTFCPECEIGLGVPRRPIRLVAPAGSPRNKPIEMPADVTRYWLAPDANGAATAQRLGEAVAA